MANSALLQIAGVMASMRKAIINGEAIPYNTDEVFAACLQATIQILCGGSPSQIVLPQSGASAGLDDAVVARFSRMSVTATPFAPYAGLNLATKTAVAADGGTTPVTFANAFATQCSQVFISVRDYSGADNAALTARVSGISTTGFSITVGGGVSGSTCSVDFLPIGS